MKQQKNRVLKFDERTPDGAIRLYSDRVDALSLADGKRRHVVTLARVVTFRDQFYGKLTLSKAMFQKMIRNFDAGVFGQKIYLDVSHQTYKGSAGEFIRLFMDGNKLRGEVEFTDYGIDAVKKLLMQYISIEFTADYEDPETDKKHGPLLFGAALTNRPRVKRLEPIELSHDGDEVPSLILPSVQTILKLEQDIIMNKHLKILLAALVSLGLHNSVVKMLGESFETAAGDITDDEQLKSLAESFAETGKTLAEEIGGDDHAINLSISAPAAGGLSADDVKKLLAEDSEAKLKLAEDARVKRDANVKLFADLLAADEGLKKLSEDDMKSLSDAADLITDDMTEDQVKALATHQIAMGGRLAAATQLASMGYQAGAQGDVRITVDQGNDVLALQGDILTNLRNTSQHALGQLSLSEKVSPFVEQVLGVFDREHMPQLLAERKSLAAGSSTISDVSLPVGFQRTVIREALADLNILNLVQTMTDPAATMTTNIPYETRDSSAVLNDGIVYEGAPIHRADVTQAMDLAYILPMKLAFLVSNEVMHFSRSSAINWDAYSRNVESNSRVMRELISKRIANEMQRSADAFGATAITAENIKARLDGSNSIIKTANFPLVRPHQQYDMQGSTVGSVEQPIAIVIDGTAIAAYDGSNAQSSGTYYQVTSYNLGYIQLVSQLGVAVTPTSATAATLGYSYATNATTFDLDPGSVALGLYLNGLLRAIGAQKALLLGSRYVTPNFALMSPTLNDTITNADQFVTSLKKDGTDSGSDGDLEKVKGIAAFGTNAPGIDLGDERIILGQRGTLTYTIAKPFLTGEPFQAVDSNGKAIGKLQAYGEEYSAIKVPTPIRNRMTSVIAYSAQARTAV